MIRAVIDSLVALLIGFFLVVSPAGADAIDESRLDPPSLAGRVSALRDPERALDLAQVLGMTEAFKPARLSENFGYTRDGVWLRIVLPAIQDARGVLVIQPNFMDYLDVYVAPERDGMTAADFEIFSMGDHRSLSDKGFSGLIDAVPLKFVAGETTVVYVNIRNGNSSTQVSLGLFQTDAFVYRRLAYLLIYGAWAGGMIALALVQLFFYYFDRQIRYPLLALSTISIAAMYVGNLGFSRVFLFSGWNEGNDIFIGVNAWWGLAASVLAASAIIETKAKSALLHRVYMAAMTVGIIGVPVALAGGNFAFAPIGTSVSFVMALFNMAVVIRYAGQDGTAGQLRAVAYSLTGIGAALTMMQKLGVNWLPFYTLHAYGAASLLQAIILTGALAMRLRDSEAMNKSMQATALFTALNAEKRAARIVEERTEELVRARHVAEDRLRAELESQSRQIQFFEAVSHQYRTPLAVIRSNVDSIGLTLPAADTKNQDRIKRVRRAVARLVEVVEINLSRSQYQGNTFQPVMAVVEVQSVAEAALRRAEDLLGNQICFECDPQAVGALIEADSEMLELAIVNLLENAMKYSSGIAMAENSDRVLLRLAQEPGFVVIEVVDNGIGIPPDAINWVMENGYRGENARHAEGSGLGLYMVSQIVEAHAGELQIESALGVGTQVRIRLAQASPA